jgi:cytochrome c-type biogenesis protein CcmE
VRPLTHPSTGWTRRRGPAGIVAILAPMRGSRIRLIVALVVASLLATILLYTVVAGKTRTYQVAELLSHPASQAGTVRLNGTVVSHAGDASGVGKMRFVLRDNTVAGRTVTVLYQGSVPDAFHNGRAVLVDGKLQHGVFMAKPGSLSTKCPSKYTATQQAAGPSQ